MNQGFAEDLSMGYFANYARDRRGLCTKVVPPPRGREGEALKEEGA